MYNILYHINISFLERLARQVEEERIQEEERKRLEEERLAYEEAQRLKKEHEDACRSKELESLLKEQENAEISIKSRALMLSRSLQEIAEALEWKKYIACDKRPQSENEADLNSFLNTWEMEKEEDLQKTLHSCEYAHVVLNDLLVLEYYAKSNNDTKTVLKTRSFIAWIMKIIQEKIDYSTAQVLLNVLTTELNVSLRSNWIKACIWMITDAKGSRNKKVNFNECDILLDVPKSIAQQNVAVRATFFPYDYKLVEYPTLLDTAVGGIFCLDLLEIPAPPKQV